MGNREELLVGAKRCLRAKGFARTTARDIAAASGVSLAAIGYHFGSKEALLTRALVEATGEWVEELGRVLASDLDADATPIERFELTWTRLLGLFRGHRQLWAANFEVSPYVETMPEVRAVMASAQEAARLGLARLFLGLDEITDPEGARDAGAFYYALLAGVIIQWLVDPDRAPSATQLARGLRIISGAGTAKEASNG
ncbi:MAG TPA: TetR/AcrR family transcriptional regulator [Caulobacteraceae bacterium]|nr:TetR/AcrR family transcriptional regulator [Caulobacteraceae bacterium]